jgi:hypothetical protein
MPSGLLDANEMTWAFVAVDRVGRAKKPLMWCYRWLTDRQEGN